MFSWRRNKSHMIWQWPWLKTVGKRYCVITVIGHFFDMPHGISHTDWNVVYPFCNSLLVDWKHLLSAWGGGGASRIANIQWLLQVRVSSYYYRFIWTDYVLSCLSGLTRCANFLHGFYIEVLKHNGNNWSFNIRLVVLDIFFFSNILFIYRGLQCFILLLLFHGLMVLELEINNFYRSLF